ncbi:LysR family transcriptional regulator [Bdellovibrionota bacterium FG-2]
MKDYNDIAAFVAVAQAGNFSSAARKLQTQKSTVSRKVLALEERLGTPLFTRTTRQVILTHEGKKYLEQIEGAYLQIDLAEDTTLGTDTYLRGSLRITAPVVLGIALLPGAITEFASLHPGVQVEILLEDRVMNLIEERVDLAIRTGELDDSSLKARKIGTSQFGLFASPRYLEKTRASLKIRRPQDLVQHQCIMYSPSGEDFPWVFTHKESRVKAKIRSQLRANTLAMAKELAGNGAGIALLPEFLCNDSLISGELVPVLPQWRAEKSAYYLVYPSSKVDAPALKALVNHLIAYFDNSKTTHIQPTSKMVKLRHEGSGR